MARVVIANVSKIFQESSQKKIQALREINLVVEDKEWLVIVGPSGSGKSTLLRLIAGLEEVSSGTISMDGKVINALPPQDRDVAMVFQNYALYPHLTVLENLALGLKLRKVAKKELDQRVEEAVEILSLKECLHRLPKALSGGQRQRVAVGRAIVLKPKIFLFDEPLSNLDAPMRVQMRLELAKIHQRLGATVLYVTHDQIEAMALGKRIAVMREGSLQQVAEPFQLYRHPANSFVAGFIGTPPMNFFKGCLSRIGDAIYFAELEQGTPAASSPKINSMLLIPQSAIDKNERLRGFVGREIILGIRPEDIAERPSENTIGENSSANSDGVEAIIETSELLGAETHVYLSTRSHRFVARLPGWRAGKSGETMRVSFAMDRGCFFDPITGSAL